MKYLKKYIKVYRTAGGWCADYVPPKGQRLTLHVACLPTRYMAVEHAKRCVEWLNRED